MVKSAGSTNYKLVEVNTLLELIEDHLPLGKDEWERLAGTYNTNRPRSWADRDFDSLRRKFKALYSIRKPTGCPNIQPHILKAKALKKAIDEKASVVEMNDEADVDSAASREYEQNMSFEYQPAAGCWAGADEEEFGLPEGTGSPTDTASAMVDSVRDVPAGEDAGPCRDVDNDTTCSEFQGLLSMPLTAEGLEAFASSDASRAPRGAHTTRSLRSASLSATTSVTFAPGGMSSSAGATSSMTTKKAKAGKKPASKGFKPGTRDEQEAQRYDSLLDYSTRLVGSDLYAFRDQVASKRKLECDGIDAAEASFAKVKRAKAIKATAALKQNLGDAEKMTQSLGSSMMEMMMLLREEHERKAELRREEEDRRRRDETVAREARVAAEKAAAEERRRQDKLELEERSRRDKEEARLRTQELVLLIGALTKKQ